MPILATIASPAQASALRAGDVVHLVRNTSGTHLVLEAPGGNGVCAFFAGVPAVLEGLVALVSEPGVDATGRLCAAVEPAAPDAVPTFVEGDLDNRLLDDLPLYRRDELDAA